MAQSGHVSREAIRRLIEIALIMTKSRWTLAKASDGFALLRKRKLQVGAEHSGNVVGS